MNRLEDIFKKALEVHLNDQSFFSGTGAINPKQKENPDIEDAFNLKVFLPQDDICGFKNNTIGDRYAQWWKDDTYHLHVANSKNSVSSIHDLKQEVGSDEKLLEKSLFTKPALGSVSGTGDKFSIMGWESKSLLLVVNIPNQ